MSTQVYEAKPYMNIRETVEKASIIANALNSDIIVVFNGTRFTIKPDMKIQDAINTFFVVRDKMTKTQQQLTQNTK